MENENVENKKPEINENVPEKKSEIKFEAKRETKHETKHEAKHEHDAKHETHHETQKKNVSHHAKELGGKIQFWPALSAVLAILLMITLFSGQTSSSNAPGASKSLDKQQFSLNMETFIRDSLTSGASNVAIENITEENGLYKFSVLIDGNLVAISYATKDGALLFPQVLDVAKVTEQTKKLKENGGTNQEQPSETQVKSDKPEVQLFVMSQCPYGVQAENAIKPVLDALKDKVSFELRFIANQKADGTFSSLHGQDEVNEDLRQVCAAKYAPATYMDYVICRNKNYRSNEWQACATEAKLDASAIKTCSEGKEGTDLLAENIKLAEELGVGGSPTIKINSADYRGQRTSEAFQTGICDAFNTAPAECANAIANANTTVNEAPHAGCGA